MFTSQISIFINRPIQEVWNYTADISNNKEWQQDTVRAEMTSSGPVGVGSTGVVVQKFMGRELENEIEITGFDPPYRMCMKTTSGPISFEGCQVLTEQDGGTLCTTEVNAEAGGFFKVAEGMVKKQLESSVERDMARLKEVMGG